MKSCSSPKGRHIYAFHTSRNGLSAMERSNEALANYCADGVMTLGEAEQERIYDYRGRFLGVAITID